MEPASADGAALQMLPPRLARFCTCRLPISRADWARAGQAAATAGCPAVWLALAAARRAGEVSLLSMREQRNMFSS